MRNVFFVLLICLISCSRPVKRESNALEVTHITGTVMTVPYSIEIGKELKASERQKVEGIIKDVFHEIDSIFNKWNPHSELSKLNRFPANKPFTLSPQLASFLKRCGEFVKLSNGAFDPTIEPLQALWKAKLIKGQKPTIDEIKAILCVLGWDKLEFIGDQQIVKKHAATALDLGGIVKGYAVDLLVERLSHAGYPDLFVEWGGEVKAVGLHPQGRNWAVYISNLDDINPEHALAYVPLQNQAIATSGDYLQNWKCGDDTYFHVFDLKTGSPLLITRESIASSSVLASDCLTADALATILLMSPNLEAAKQKAKELQTKFPESVFWLLSRKEIAPQA